MPLGCVCRSFCPDATSDSDGLIFTAWVAGPSSLWILLRCQSFTAVANLASHSVCRSQSCSVHCLTFRFSWRREGHATLSFLARRMPPSCCHPVSRGILHPHGCFKGELAALVSYEPRPKEISLPLLAFSVRGPSLKIRPAGSSSDVGSTCTVDDGNSTVLAPSGASIEATDWLTWAESALHDFFRTFVLLYLLCFFRLWVHALPQAKSSPRTNRALRATRHLLRGAPLCLVLAVCVVTVGAAPGSDIPQNRPWPRFAFGCSKICRLRCGSRASYSQLS